MSLHSAFKARLSASGDAEPQFLADLSTWFRQRMSTGALPLPWQGLTLHDLYRELGLPIWDTVRLWKEQFPGLEVRETSEGKVRSRTVETGSGPLQWRWEIDSDGVWQQTVFPISGPADMPAAVQWARALEYQLDTTGLTELEASIGDEGILTVELPPRPAIQLGASLIGWDRLHQLLDEPAVDMILRALENHVQALVTALGQLSPAVHLSPDDLSTAIAPAAFFSRYLMNSYRETMEDLAEYRKVLLVRVQRASQELLTSLAESGVTGVYGLESSEGCISPGAASAELGERLALWGGLPARVLSREVSVEAFEQAVRTSAADAAGHRGVLLGLCGPWPSDPDLTRLSRIPSLIRAV